MKPIVITIDSPADDGKTTVGKLVAKNLVFVSCWYRSDISLVTYMLLKLKIPLNDVNKINSELIRQNGYRNKNL
mgnify:CR=1 FL=1